MQIKMIYFILFVSLLFLTCEKYINSQTDSNFYDQEIMVSGTVLNEFTNDPVYQASVTFEGLQTFTDPEGKFLIAYKLTVDDNRNKPIQMTISADNYLGLIKEFVIAPIDYTLNIRLTYAAPIVRNSVFVFHLFPGYENPLVVVQALIFDYQEITDIDTAQTYFYYVNQQTKERKTSIIPMVFVENVSANAAHYQAIAIPSYQDVWQIQKYFDIEVKDKSNYSTYIQDSPNAHLGDKLIFTPIYYPPKTDSIFTK
jgi:hypothetical protein